MFLNSKLSSQTEPFAPGNSAKSTVPLGLFPSPKSSHRVFPQLSVRIRIQGLQNVLDSSVSGVSGAKWASFLTKAQNQV